MHWAAILDAEVGVFAIPPTFCVGTPVASSYKESHIIISVKPIKPFVTPNYICL